MRIFFHKDFEKGYKKLPPQEQKRFDERLIVFVQDPFDQILRNHPLRGKLKGYRSVNITSDLRAIYKFQGNDEFIFVVIDSHSNLYK